MGREFLRLPSIRTLRAIFIWGGVAMAAFGVFCLTNAPRQIILTYFSHDNMLNPETIAALILMGVFFCLAGASSTAVALFRPRLIERAAALPRGELLYGTSVFGTNLLVFFGLALGTRNLAAYAKILAIVIVGAALFFVERRISREIAGIYGVVFDRWVAVAGYLALGTFFFVLRFPIGTWNRFIFSRDYPMFQYTAQLDLNVLKQGFPYGWEPTFSNGYPTFLNLRSLLIPYLPFSLAPPAFAFHLMLYATYVGVPFLVYWVAKEISDDRDMAVLSGWAAVGAMAGYMWHIVHWGMAPTFESIPFLLLATGFFVRALKGSRWGVLLAAFFWAPVAYIHFGHFAHVGIVLFIAAVVYLVEERKLRPARLFAETVAFTALFAAPYLLLFWRYKGHIILTNMFSYPDESLVGMARAFLITVSHFIPTLMWSGLGVYAAREFPDYGYLALATVFSLVILFLVGSERRSNRVVGLLYAGAIAVSALSFVPKLELSFQRMLYMVPPLMALAWGFWLGEAKKRGHVTAFYVLAALVIFYARPVWTGDKTIPTLADRGAFDPAVVEKVKSLGGNAVLFEDTASLTPYEDPDHAFDKVPEERDVHCEGFLAMETGKRFFSHPGYNPHPYYDLRWTYITSGTYLGKDLDDYSPDLFKELFRKWGVEYLVLWSGQAKAFFGRDADYEKVMSTAQYTVYRFLRADPRAVVVESGSGDVAFSGNFSAIVTLEGVAPGSAVTLRANYFPEWRAECDGKPVALENAGGQIAFRAPASDAAVHLTFPRYRIYFLIPAVGLLAGIALSAAKRL